jgi:hypothetical protein
LSAPLQVYLTRADWLAVTAAFERRCPVRYARAGEVDGEVPCLGSAQDAEDFGVAPTGDESTNPWFLVLPADAEPVARVAERRAGVDRLVVDRRVVDHLGNPRSLQLRPGGAFGGLYVIVGEVALPSCDPWVESAHLALLEDLFALTRAVGGFRVGPDALQRMRGGARLTPYVDGDTLYDLREA